MILSENKIRLFLPICISSYYAKCLQPVFPTSCWTQDTNYVHNWIICPATTCVKKENKSHFSHLWPRNRTQVCTHSAKRQFSYHIYTRSKYMTSIDFTPLRNTKFISRKVWTEQLVIEDAINFKLPTRNANFLLYRHNECESFRYILHTHSLYIYIYIYNLGSKMNLCKYSNYLV